MCHAIVIISGLVKVLSVKKKKKKKNPAQLPPPRGEQGATDNAEPYRYGMFLYYTANGRFSDL